MEKYIVFVASPSDVIRERNQVENVIKEINLTHGPPLGYQLELWRYEENAYPSALKPQDLINSIIKPYQIFVGIMWKRFGTPTAAADSGTEEEYNSAYTAWQKKDVMNIMFYFCKKPFSPEEEDELEQMAKVLKFKKEMNGKSLIWDYDTPNDFEQKIRKHLCLTMSDIIQNKKKSIRVKAIPDENAIHIFKTAWNNMTPELKNYLSVPYNENRMKGDGGIQTRDLFAAMVTNPTPGLNAVMKHFPEKAMPQPIEGKLTHEHYIADEKPWLSHCIISSIERLNKALPAGEQITPLDVFIDIARNGSGESVKLLREHNIYPETIEHILKQEHLKVLRG